MGARTPCALEAMAMVNALGARNDEIWRRLVAGDTSGMVPRDGLVPDRTLLLGEVRAALPPIPRRLRRFASRNNALTLLALEALRDALEGVLARVPRGRVGVVMGTSTSGVSDAEAAIRHQHETGALAPEFAYEQLEFGGAAGFVAELLELEGPAFTLSTACSSGAHALASGRSLLALGACDAVIAGATDTLCGLTTNGFHALQAIAPELTNPMSAHRRGLSLGEGATLFLLTKRDEGVQLLGVGESSEAHHMSAPDPEGGGAEAAMRAALADAGAAPEAVAYLNLHGTGTPQNDAMESHAVARVLGTAVPCSSTKPLVGHTLGAAGAMEAGFCWMMLRQRDAAGLAPPPHCFDGARDPELPRIRLASKGERVATPALALVMTNSFGFGGNNCTLVLGESGAAWR